MPEEFDQEVAVSILNALLEERTVERAKALHNYIIAASTSLEAPVSCVRPNFPVDVEPFSLRGQVRHAFAAHADKIVEWCEGIVNQVLPPQPVTGKELAALFMKQLCVPVEWFAAAYDVFVGRVLDDLLAVRSSRPFPVAELPAESELTAAADHISNLLEHTGPDEHGTDVLWSRNGIYLRLRGLAEAAVAAEAETFAQPPWLQVHFLQCDVAGAMSPAACSKIAASFQRLIPSVLRTVDICGPRSLLHADLVKHKLSSLPLIYRQFSRDHVLLIRQCLDSAVCLPTKKEDTFGRRIGNAVRLMADADDQVSPAVALALRITALEALIGSSQTELSRTLADGVATLLEPDASRRADAARFTKDLYDVRSKVLHGCPPDDNLNNKNINARKLVAAVTIALLDQRQYHHRLGTFKGKSGDDFVAELQQLKFRPGQPNGVRCIEEVREMWPVPPL